MKKISLSVVCPMASCTRSNTCARYAQYVKALTCADTFEVLNGSTCSVRARSAPIILCQKNKYGQGDSSASTVPSRREEPIISIPVRLMPGAGFIRRRMAR